MYFVGPHVSIGGGVDHAPANAAAVGATGFGMFTKNQLQWQAPAIAAETRTLFAAALAAHRFTPQQVLPHAGYLINLANPDEAAHARALDSFIGEVRRCEELGLKMLNLHPGSHLRKLDPMAACARVAGAVNEALRQTRGVTVVIENTAGQGACLGSTFVELAAIIAGVQDPERIGVCLDTAHTFAAGFDIRTRDGLRRTLDDFDRIVGFRYLRGMHLNDSKAAFNSHVDRHESLGRGQIGWEPFQWIMQDPRFAGMPLVVETPDETLWPEEIKRLLELAG
ncbi:MAG: deoxyribonuclease IV [bacterium]